MLGAGTGGLFLLRWFWWRISAATEIAAMVISLVVAIYFTWFHDVLADESIGLVLELGDWQKLVWGTSITTLGWLACTWLFPPEKDDVLRKFVAKTGVSGPGWRRFEVDNQSTSTSVAQGLLQAFLGCIAVYGVLMATGSALYGHVNQALSLGGLGIVAAVGVFVIHRRTT